MSDYSENKRLAKNTLLMYFRMFLIMGINLYTSRVVLRELGIDDFGIYTIVSGIIVSFSFISTALTSAVQRFLAFTLGEKDYDKFQRTFTTSLFLFVIISVILCLILIPLGNWLIYDYLVLPDERRDAAMGLFLLILPNFFAYFVGIPFNSAIIAKERMAFFAYLGIIEAILRLIVVFMLAFSNYDKLITYGVLLLLVALIMMVLNAIYVTNKLNLKLSLRCDNKILKDISIFSGWSLFDALASIGKIEFVNFILNIFYGITINAAVGIAKQINSAINSFTFNFQTAFKPQLTKTYANGDNDRVLFLVFNTSKFSGIIFFVVAIPLIINMKYVLRLWLGDYPVLTPYFAVFFLISAGLEALCGPFWILSHAIGNIRNFQLITSFIRLLAVPMVYLYITMGFSVIGVFSMVVVSDLCILVYRIYYLKKKINFPVRRYVSEVLLKICVSIAIVCVLSYIVMTISNVEWITLILTTLLSCLLYGLLTLFYFMNNSQRAFVVETLHNKINRFF